MSDEYRIDSHKLIFHPALVSKWLKGEDIYPIYLEISPSGACNHRCTFCALDFVGYKARFLDATIMKERLSEMGSLGVKSIMYAGEGEPLLHRNIADIILHTKDSGMDVALTTNGVLLSKSLFERIAGSVAWIKVSINAGTPETYERIHKTKQDDFQRVMQNLAEASRIVKERGWNCTLGAQAVLLPENAGEMEILAKKIKGIGLKYLVVKPYSQHLKSHTQVYKEIEYSAHLPLKERLERLNDDDFQVVFREHTMKKLRRLKRGYGRCLALPFWSYIDSGGNVWGCSAYLGDEAFRYGSIYENTFEEIWKGERRRESMKMVCTDLDPSVCRINCRMDEINIYLWELTHPSPHVNFI